jgi:hypothetical protein
MDGRTGTLPAAPRPHRADREAGAAEHLLRLDTWPVAPARDRPVLDPDDPLGRPRHRPAPTRPGPTALCLAGRSVHPGPAVRKLLVPQLYEQFIPARPVFWRLNDDLLGTVLNRRRRIPGLRRFAGRVQVIFGACDRYLNARVAKNFALLVPQQRTASATRGRALRSSRPTRAGRRPRPRMSRTET